VPATGAGHLDDAHRIVLRQDSEARRDCRDGLLDVHQAKRTVFIEALAYPSAFSPALVLSAVVPF
jgi:hypothetical protein